MGDGTEEYPYIRKDVLRLIEENGGTAEGLDLSGKFFKEFVNLNRLDLQGVNLSNTHLKVADLSEAHLECADLSGAYLEGADLGDAHLEGAFLWATRFSFDTNLELVDWGNYILGEEKSLEVRGEVREEHLDMLAVDNVYRRLKQWYTNVGIYDVAGNFFYREMEIKRKALQWKKKPFSKLWRWVLRLLCGYGERPLRVVVWAASVVVGLAAIYYFWGSFSSSSFWDTLYYSAASFTALGYGQWAPQPIGWAKYMGAVEAFIGVFSMALFLVTFTRKMTR